MRSLIWRNNFTRNWQKFKKKIKTGNEKGYERNKVEVLITQKSTRICKVRLTMCLDLWWPFLCCFEKLSALKSHWNLQGYSLQAESPDLTTPCCFWMLQTEWNMYLYSLSSGETYLSSACIQPKLDRFEGCLYKRMYLPDEIISEFKCFPLYFFPIK